ncbi:MAG: alkyl hydroperoxide reductase/Thiol specific antioxidant/Mal allergen [Myxococcaceae bacterium]|nr:alkyl hydroperoxide reductase/Thiol specific antioxidant/Mal allergen [Myxococcaceae bacterium]
MIEEGKKAPAFSLPASLGSEPSSKQVKLSDFAGKRVVLYFYPRDSTPGCTTEANDFQAAGERLKKLNAVALGVSKDSVESHCKFSTKYQLAFPLLSDVDGKVIEKYGAWGEKNLYGKKSMGIVRSTVLIDEAGVVRKVWPKVKVNGHVEAVLEALASL